jgi:hypothetical protein
MPVIGGAFIPQFLEAADSLIGIVLRLSAAQQRAQDNLISTLRQPPDAAG